MISGKTKLIAHLGYPTESFKAPMIYNPYFEKHGIDVGRRADGGPARRLPRLPEARSSASRTSTAR